MSLTLSSSNHYSGSCLLMPKAGGLISSESEQGVGQCLLLLCCSVIHRYTHNLLWPWKLKAHNLYYILSQNKLERNSSEKM